MAAPGAPAAGHRMTRVLATVTALLCVATLVALVALSPSHLARVPLAMAFNTRAIFFPWHHDASAATNIVTPSIRRRPANDSSLQGALQAALHDAKMAPVRAAYNETTALYLAHVTSVSYCQEQHIRNWSCGPCALVPRIDGALVVADARDNFQGLVGYSALYNAVVVAFRGSMDITNWIDNFTFTKKRAYKDFPNVKVHQGFYWAYRSVATQVLPAVRKQLKMHPSASVMVTGHSLGAAVAAICTFELHFVENITVNALYSFGEPRVGNPDFSTMLHNSSIDMYRITHFRDVVPHLPPTWVGFQHTTREVFYDQFQSSYTLCDAENAEDITCSDACSPLGCTSVVDHLTYLNVTMSHLIC
ncbi:hypothetical protein Gpo141_00002657 [Globisporangium polare]